MSPLPCANQHRFGPGQINDRRRLHAARASVEHEVDFMVEPLANVLAFV